MIRRLKYIHLSFTFIMNSRKTFRVSIKEAKVSRMYSLPKKERLHHEYVNISSDRTACVGKHGRWLCSRYVKV